MALLCNICVASPVCPKQVNGGYISIGSECCKAVQKLAEALKPSHNSAMVPCPHLWIGTDGVHHTIINQCNHPLVKDWAQHQ